MAHPEEEAITKQACDAGLTVGDSAEGNVPTNGNGTIGDVGSPVELSGGTAPATLAAVGGLTSPRNSRSIPASLSHALLTLIGFSFITFEVVFIFLYLASFWLSADIQMLGVPAMLLVVAYGHFALTFLESNYVCRLLAFILKGKPPVLYKKWITYDDFGLSFGLKQVSWASIDELEQTIFGNLILKSRMLCGPHAFASDVTLKFPFTAADPDVRKELVDEIIRRRPAVLLNKRLKKGLDSPFTASTRYTQLMTAAFMTLVLLDLGYSSFHYLQVLKEYYFAEVSARAGDAVKAQRSLAAGDDLRAHPLAISYLSSHYFLGATSNASDLDEQRALVLWFLGKHKEAIAESKKALERDPKVLRRNLRQVRLLVGDGQLDEAEKELESTLEEHESALLARLYLLAVIKEKGVDQAGMQAKYKEQLDKCYENTFGAEPHWPPLKGNNFFHELIHSEDLRFVMDRLLNLQKNGDTDWYTPPKDLETRHQAF